MDEIWKEINGFDGKYLISNFGNVKTNKNKIISKSGNRYLKVCLSYNGKIKYKDIHRLVAIAFIPNPKNKPQVNHINGNKKDNCVNNLEWCSCKENINHAFDTGLNKRKRKIMQIDNNGKIINIFDSLTQATKITGVNCGNICSALKEKQKQAGGYIWEYYI